MTDDVLDFDASHFVSNEPVVTPKSVDSYDDELPEILRIKGFMSNIEEELSIIEQAEVTVISAILNDDESDDGLTLECDDQMDLSYFPEFESSFGDNNSIRIVSPMRNVSFKIPEDDLSTPVRTTLANLSLSELVKHETPHSKVDAFLEMLRKAGYTYLTAKELAEAAAARQEGLDTSQLSETVRDYFFSSTPKESESKRSAVGSHSSSNPLSPVSGTGSEGSSIRDLDTVDMDLSASKAAAAVTASKIEEDLRLKADFSVWSRGVKCSVYGVRETYIGLNETALTHDVANGVLVVPTEPLISPKTVAGTASGGDTNKFSSALHSNPTGGASATAAAGGSGYYSVHALECLLRPDILLTAIVTSVIKVAKQYHHKIVPQQRSHLVLTLAKAHRNSFESIINNLTNTNKDAVTADDLTNDMDEASVFRYQQQAVKEYDMIDIQVCISKELRQRVLFVQFLKKVPVLKVAALGGLLINSLAGSAVTVKPLSESPATKLFMTQLKLELVNGSMSLSALYSCNLRSICCLPTGLDTHFKAQLHTLVRDAMWTKLEADYKNMDSHVTEQEVECTAFTKSMEFVYKQYNISMPNPWNLQRKLHPPSRTAHAPSPVVITASDLPGTPIKLRRESEDETAAEEEELSRSSSRGNSGVASSEVSPAKQTPDRGIAGGGADVEKSYEDSVEELLNLRSVSTPEDFRLLTDNKKNHNTDSPSHVMMDAQNLSNVSPLTNTERSAIKTPASSSSRRKETPHQKKVDSGYVGGIASARKLDGMTFCLVMLDKCYQELQRECDAEYSARMQQRNATTVQMIDDIFDYKQSLLSALVHLPNIMESTVMKKYLNTFKNIPVTTSLAMHQELCSANSKTLHVTKSWLGGGGGTAVAAHNANSASSGLSHLKSEQTMPVVQSSPSPSPSSGGGGGGSWLWGSKPTTPQHKPPVQPSPTHVTHSIQHPAAIAVGGSLHDPIVLFYCMCMVNKVPATVYVTTWTVSIEYNNMIGSWIQYAGGVSGGEAVTVAKSGKEIYPLKALTEMTMTTLGSGMMNAVLLSFNFDSPAGTPTHAAAEEVKNVRELTVSPVAMECTRLRAVILEVKRKFSV